MFQRLKNWLALTVAEQRVILFLVAAFLIGAGIRLYRETFPPPQPFDYRSTDSTFAALSEAIIADTSLTEDNDAAGLVNVNTATKSQLLKVPGIGEVTATRILAYRKDVGEFRKIDDLGNVKGISKKKLEKLRPFLTVY
jgi:competence ComEA-like helix-hairpin-helix protein